MTKPSKFSFLDQAQKFIIFSNGCLDLSTNLLIGNMVLVPNAQYPQIASHLKGLRFFFSNSTVKVYDSQVYKNMEMTRKRISFTFDPRDMLVSLQMGFSFVRVAMACAILERTSGLEPSSEITTSMYLKLVTVPSFCHFTFISLSGCHWLCLSSVWSSRH